MKPGFHRFRAHSENFRSLLDAHSLDHSGDEHAAKRRGQIVDRILEKHSNLLLGHGSFGVARRMGCRKLEDFGSDLIFPLLLPADRRTLPAQAPERFIYCDTGEPGGEA